MLRSFEWIRLCQTGSELIATLEYLAAAPDLLMGDMELGAPFSALTGPCQRCWCYAPVPEHNPPGGTAKSLAVRYCRGCHLITTRAAALGSSSRHAIVVWSYVNLLPRNLPSREGFYERHVMAQYIHDQYHFLLLLDRRKLQPWLQELALCHGPELKGHIQIFPTVGKRRGLTMGEILNRAVHHEARFTMDQLRIRFYAAPHQILRPHVRDRQGLLTFEAADFLGLLETASVFRTLLHPEKQSMLYELLQLQDPAERQFYWGRFLGYVDQKTKDMLNAWNIRQWPENRVELLYELLDYAVFDPPY